MFFKNHEREYVEGKFAKTFMIVPWYRVKVGVSFVGDDESANLCGVVVGGVYEDFGSRNNFLMDPDIQKDSEQRLVAFWE